jgi:hypothetical protein
LEKDQAERHEGFQVIHRYVGKQKGFSEIMLI